MLAFLGVTRVQCINTKRKPPEGIAKGMGQAGKERRMGRVHPKCMFSLGTRG